MTYNISTLGGCLHTELSPFLFKIENGGLNAPPVRNCLSCNARFVPVRILDPDDMTTHYYDLEHWVLDLTTTKEKVNAAR